MIRKLTMLALCAVFLLGSCNRAESVVDIEMGKAFKIRYSAAEMVETKSPVSGEEGIFAMQLLCFDEFGLYVGLGSVTSFSGGYLTGSVPSATSRIHFIANAGIVPSDGWIGESENRIIPTLTASVSNTHIVYWGYHKEADSNAMAVWLDPSAGNRIYLLRDRAMVSMDQPDPTFDHNPSLSVTEYITGVEFSVANGLENGCIAPFDKGNLSNPFVYDSNGTGTDPNPLTLPEGNARFPGDESQMKGVVAGQFLFEDENYYQDPAKVILRVSYERDESGTVSSFIKYHQVLLMKEDYSLYKIKRNHRYNIIVGELPSDGGYDSFAEAVEGSPSNNRTIVIREVVPEIISGEYTMNILEGTTQIFLKDTTIVEPDPQYAEIEFSYLRNGAADPAIGVSNFSASWVMNQYVAYPNTVLEIFDGSEPGRFVLKVQLYSPITEHLKSGKILLLDKAHGLARYISIYSITGFKFSPALTAAENQVEPYLLNFTIPEDFPAGLFPFNVCIATEDFDATTEQNSIQALGAEVGDTVPLIGETWNYWYTFEVRSPGDYTIRLKRLKQGTEKVSLYLFAKYFDMEYLEV